MWSLSNAIHSQFRNGFPERTCFSTPRFICIFTSFIPHFGQISFSFRSHLIKIYVEWAFTSFKTQIHYTLYRPAATLQVHACPPRVPRMSLTRTTCVPRADHACGRVIKRVMVRHKATSCSKLSTMADTLDSISVQVSPNT